MATANPYLGAARATLGQGLGMGWGDEAEAWLRSKLSGSKGYESELAKINQEYAQYSKENPFVAPALEFTGGAAPALAAMLATPATGGATAPVAGSALARLAANPYVRGAVTGGVTGAVSGAGSAQPGERGSGAATGTVVGTVVGGGAPAVIRGGGAAAQWLRDRLAPSEATVTKSAVGKVSRAINESGMTPQQIEKKVLQDRARNIPSTIANADPALVDLAETVAQRSGPSGRLVEKKLGEQTAGARERTYAQTRKAIKSGEFYADEQKMVADLRKQANTLYDDAYAFGDVDDPRIIEALKNPRFQDFWGKARSIADTEAQAAKLRGEDPSKFALPEIYKPSGKFDANGNEILELAKLPDVRTLDYIKRGIDATIESGYKSAQGMSSAEANALKQLRNVYVNAIDEATGGAKSPYLKARQAYSGDMEVLDAMRSGMNDFNKLDHEQVIDMISKMGSAEKDAFRTGVVRDLYSKIMDPSSNINAAQRIIGAPEMQAKLQPLFDSPAKFEMFKSALEREAQLFQQSNRILGGAATGRRTQARERFEEGSGVGTAVADAVSGGFWGSLTNMAARIARSANMTDEVAEKVGKLLMSSDPHEVAAAVKLIEQYDVKAAAGAKRLGKGETGAIMGTTTAFPPSPIDPNAPVEDVETAPDMPNIPGGRLIGPDIDADIEADMRKVK
ncbi:MAG: hypothetical protein ACKO0Z_13795 [Betaproteobacteria bacterium]